VFVALSMDFEVIAEVFMPIRITCPDESLYGMQPDEIKRLPAAHLDGINGVLYGQEIEVPHLYNLITVSTPKSMMSMMRASERAR